jgi:hypothetical protein
MPRKVCQTVQGDSVCCQAAQQGLLGRPITFTTRTGARRCGQCDVVPSQSRDPRKAGRPVFRFRFHANSQCGIGPRGCAALAQMGVGGGGGMQLPGGGGFALPAPGGPFPALPAPR